MKRAFLYVYLNNNFGDDLFVHLLTRRYRLTKFYVLCDKKGASTVKHHPNVHPFGEGIIFRLVNKVSRTLFGKEAATDFMVKWCGLTIYLGGSLFMEQGDWKKEFARLEEMEAHSKKFCIIGANFGPYHTEEYRQVHEKFFSRLSDICFRDQYTYRLFSKNCKNVRLAPDVAFNLELMPSERPERLVTISCISVKDRDDIAVDQETYVLQQRKLCEAFAAEHYWICLLSLCEPQGDLETCNEIYEGLPPEVKRRVDIVNYSGDMEKIFWVLDQSEVIMAGRFHCMVVGWLVNRNTIPVIYNDKMRNVIEDIEYRGLSYELSTEVSYDIWDIRANEEQVPLKLEQYTQEAKKQYQYLDGILKRVLLMCE